MDNIRSESFLGSDKVIVGNKYTDLVLETLGKVYIKTGNSSRVLSDVLALLDKTAESDLKSQTIIVGSSLEMEEMEYPGDGFFIYNTLTTTLYISYDERYIALIEAAEGAGDGYVRRKGDTMTGQLEINTVGSPLIVASSKLVRNLNAEYIDGYASGDLAKKKVDEYIYGNWTFKGKNVAENNWTFKENIRMYGDIITSRSVSTPEFASGFGGYGWRIDSDTNTLTIDYLIVRKAMRVYEMVINKISATNGSVWVSNSSKCSKAVQPVILTDTHLKSIGLWSGTNENKWAALKFLTPDTYYLVTDDSGAWNKNLDNYKINGQGGIVTLTSELSKPSGINTNPKTFINYKYIVYVKDAITLVNSPLFVGAQTLYDEVLLSSEWSTYTGSASKEQYKAFKKCISLFYIAKEKVVTEWDDTTPKVWQYRHTFDRDKGFFMIPNNATAIADFETNGSNSSYLTKILTYYKYFGLDKLLMSNSINTANVQFNNGNTPTTPVPNLWVINTDDDEYPLFKPGDILRCQKYSDGNIKYYDALVTAQIGARQFILMKAPSVFDIYTEISYNTDGSIASTKEKYNSTQYSKTEEFYNVNTGSLIPKTDNDGKATSANPDSSADDSLSRLDDISQDDDMIQVGNIFDTQRQNAIYLTSSDEKAPYIDVIAGLNRPDYSVLYDIPLYEIRTVVYNQTKQDFYIQSTLTNETTEIYIDGKMYYGSLSPTRESIIKQKDGKYRHANTKTTRVRVGNLAGIYNEVFGKKQPYGFGLYGENVFLTGEFYLSNGTSIVDFSEENILLKFKMAGLVIQDVNPIQQVPVIGLDGKPTLDEEGNQIYRNKSEIVMTADQMRFNTVRNKTAMTLITEDPNTGEAMLDLQGQIQSHGLRVGTGSGDNFVANCIISKEGNITAKNANISGTVIARVGYLGGREEITNISSPHSLEYLKMSSPYIVTNVSNNIVNVFRYPNDPNSVLLSDGVVPNNSGNITTYTGGFLVKENSISAVPGNYTNGNVSMNLYSSGSSPWIQFSYTSPITTSSGTINRSTEVRMGINTLPTELASIGCLYISSEDRDTTIFGGIINIKGGYNTVGLSVSAQTWNSMTNTYEPGPAIVANGTIQCNNWIIAGRDKGFAIWSDRDGHYMPGKTIRINGIETDKDGWGDINISGHITIVVKGGIIVGVE